MSATYVFLLEQDQIVLEKSVSDFIEKKSTVLVLLVVKFSIYQAAVFVE